MSFLVNSYFSYFFSFIKCSISYFYEVYLLIFETFFIKEANLFLTMCSVRVDFIVLDINDHFFPIDLTNLSN